MFKLQIRRKKQDWRTIKEASLSDNVVVQAMAYAHGGPGYPLFRIIDGAGQVAYETFLDGTTKENDPAFERIRGLVKKMRSQM